MRKVDDNPEVPLRPARVKRSRPTKRRKHAWSEDELLQLVFRTFTERGFEGTTVRDLSKQLGVSHNLLHVRFGSKKQLWCRAVNSQVAKMRAPIQAILGAQDMDDEVRLRELICCFCRVSFEYPEFIGLTISEGRRRSWRLDYLAKHYLIDFNELIGALLERIAARRPTRPISCAAFTAIVVQGIGFYFASSPLLERVGALHEIAPDVFDRQVQTIANFILGGLFITTNPPGRRLRRKKVRESGKA